MKRILAIILASVMMLGAVALFAGCDGKDDSVLVMATNATFPPYEYKSGDKIVGIDAEIAEAIAKKLGKTLEIKDVEFSSIVGGVAEGKYDFGMAGMTVTEDRKKSVNFSTTYATGIQVIIVKDGSDIETLDSIWEFNEDGDPVALKNTDIRVGVQQGTTGDIYCSDAVEKWGFNDLNEDGSTKTERVVRYKNGAQAVEALKSGKVDLVIIDNEPAKSFVEANEGVHILEGENEYVIEDYAICVGKDNDKLLADINKALKELTEDGTIAAIIEKYIPSNGGEADTSATEAEGTVEETAAATDAATDVATASETDAATAA